MGVASTEREHHRVGPCKHNRIMSNAVKRFTVAVLAAGALAGIAAPTAHADPYCDPTNQNYNYQLCTDEPQNDPNCWGGDNAQCMRDWQHVATQPAPPGGS